MPQRTNQESKVDPEIKTNISCNSLNGDIKDKNHTMGGAVTSAFICGVFQNHGAL